MCGLIPSFIAATGIIYGLNSRIILRVDAVTRGIFIKRLSSV